MLYEFANDNHINIVNGKFSETKKAVCMGTRRHKNIIINKPAIESRAEETVILSEEIGHFETGALYVIQSTYNTPIARSNRIKFEAKARHWAYSTHCQPYEIEAAYALMGTYGDAAVADYCSVTVEFLHNAIEHHRACGFVFSFDDNNCA